MRRIVLAIVMSLPLLASAEVLNLNPELVEFRIANGTGEGSWNSLETAVTVQVGQTLRFFNDDSVPHQLHTDGAPCGHGRRIAPGQSWDCVISLPHEASEQDLYDHGYGPEAQVYIQANP